MKKIPVYKASTVEEQCNLFKKISKLGIVYYYPTNFGGEHRWGYDYGDYTNVDHICDYPYTSIDIYCDTQNHIVSWGNRPHLLTTQEAVDCNTVEEFVAMVKKYLDIPAVYISKNLKRHELLRHEILQSW